MDEGGNTTGRPPVLGQALDVWCACDAPPTWDELLTRLGGLAETLCLIGWTGPAGEPVIMQAGAQAIIAYGGRLVGEPVGVLTPGRDDAAREVEQVRDTRQPFTVEDQVGGEARRVARLYLPLMGSSPTVACAVVRVD